MDADFQHSDSSDELDNYFDQPLVVNPQCPEARSGHVAVAFGNCVVVWGGYTDRVNIKKDCIITHCNHCIVNCLCGSTLYQVVALFSAVELYTTFLMLVLLHVGLYHISPVDLDMDLFK